MCCAVMWCEAILMLANASSFIFPYKYVKFSSKAAGRADCSAGNRPELEGREGMMKDTRMWGY